MSYSSPPKAIPVILSHHSLCFSLCNPYPNVYAICHLSPPSDYQHDKGRVVIVTTYVPHQTMWLLREWYFKHLLNVFNEVFIMKQPSSHGCRALTTLNYT